MLLNYRRLFMKQITLVGRREVIVDKRSMQLEYYLIQESSVSKESEVKSIYGIKIQKLFGEAIESDEVGGISYSKEVVLQLIDTLMKATVTPLTMVEVLDDLITERLCG